MPDVFTASNRVRIVTDEGFTRIQPEMGSGFTLPLGGAQALREFFQHERDEELGRWRDPEHPGIFAVGFAHDPNVVQIMDERELITQKALRSDLSVVLIPEHRAVAERFFAAHPEPKPWHDAKPGEVWILRVLNGPEFSYGVNGEGQFRGSQDGYCPDGDEITAGRRIWPEDAHA